MKKQANRFTFENNRRVQGVSSNGWSRNLRDATRRILRDIPLESFLFRPEGCYMKNLDGRHGYITLQNALDRCYLIHLLEPGGEHSDTRPRVDTVCAYPDVETLLNDGWAVD